MLPLRNAAQVAAAGLIVLNGVVGGGGATSLPLTAAIGNIYGVASNFVVVEITHQVHAELVSNDPAVALITGTLSILEICKTVGGGATRCTQVGGGLAGELFGAGGAGCFQSLHGGPIHGRRDTPMFNGPPCATHLFAGCSMNSVIVSPGVVPLMPVPVGGASSTMGIKGRRCMWLSKKCADWRTKKISDKPGVKAMMVTCTADRSVAGLFNGGNQVVRFLSSCYFVLSFVHSHFYFSFYTNRSWPWLEWPPMGRPLLHVAWIHY